LKIGRFDPDKRWLMAVAAMAHLKRSGSRVKLVMRGGREPHGGEVLGFAHRNGLRVVDVATPADVAGLSALLREHGEADVLNLTTFVSDDLVASLYAACDAVLANSGHEPFGLVGL
jgi:glycosyltransferase involved in cell wall biosynthesis